MKYYYYVLAAVLVGGCVFDHYACAVALLFTLGARVLEISFEPPPIFPHETELQEMKLELQKFKTKAEQESLGKAFVRGNV